MPYVVAIVSSHGSELQRRAARTEPDWTFADLYSSLLISDEYQVLDITEWVSVELPQPTELCTIFQKDYILFRVVRDGTVRSEQSTFSVLMQGALKMHAFLWYLKKDDLIKSLGWDIC